MSSWHLLCNLHLFTFSGVPNLFQLTLVQKKFYVVTFGSPHLVSILDQLQLFLQPPVFFAQVLDDAVVEILVVASEALRTRHAGDQVVGQLLEFLVLNFGELFVDFDA